MFRFARSAGLPSAEAEDVADARHIGDQNVAAPTDTRAATTVERSAGNAKARGEALPIPEGHDAAKDAPTARSAVARPSPVAVTGEDSTAGARPGVGATAEARGQAQPTAGSAPPPAGPGGLRLWVAGELSDADLERVRSPLPPPPVTPRPPVRRKPVRIPTREEPDASTLAATAAPAQPPRPPPESDGFWGGIGVGDVGLGTTMDATPAAVAGDDVQKATFSDEGAGWTDLTMLDETVTEADNAQVAVRRTALGVWFAPVDDLVRAGWTVPRAAKALGVTGRVIVEFVIDKHGAVKDVTMIDANVDLDLQLAALAAVPAAVPPPPGGTGALRVRYTFRYGGQARGQRAVPDPVR
ncbi:MAG: TonB family protein [Myxococcales bacterium]|nr:TonB family protein [Myxococcales bacterium]